MKIKAKEGSTVAYMYINSVPTPGSVIYISTDAIEFVDDVILSHERIQILVEAVKPASEKQWNKHRIDYVVKVNGLNVAIDEDPIVAVEWNTETGRRSMSAGIAQESALLAKAVDGLAEAHNVNGLIEELRALLNKYNRESYSNTPDFILAQYVMKCTSAFDEAVVARADWYGRHDAPGGWGGAYRDNPETVSSITGMLYRELGEHGYEDDDEKRGQIAHHWTRNVMNLLYG